jgi:creatinine amidohydrolase
MQLRLMTWQEVEDYLQQSKGIIIPIGSTEQHGPTGLIGTDAICPEVIAAEVGQQGATLVAPTLSIGMAQHHLGFPGSVAFRPSTLIAVIGDVVNSLAVHGFSHIYFLNGHGGNVASLSAAFSEIYAGSSFATAPADRPRLRLRSTNWYQGSGVRKISDELFGDAEGSHATPSEVSLTYYAYPEAIKHADMHPKVAPHGPIRDAQDYRRRFPDGRIGSDPALASVEAGERLFEAAVADVLEDYGRFIRQD